MQEQAKIRHFDNMLREIVGIKNKTYERMYETYLPEMADYILNKELNANSTMVKSK